MLTERRQRLLQFIVDEYVNTAQPVGSGAIVQKYHLPLSSATVRNEMACLEEEGYIVQPHTSAGRVPPDRGPPPQRPVRRHDGRPDQQPWRRAVAPGVRRGRGRRLPPGGRRRIRP